MSPCNLETLGNGDIYGLGVQIGLYLQWASGFILRDIGSWETVARVRTANNVLGGALALAAAINIATGSALSVDYLLSYYLTVGLFYNESYLLNDLDHKAPGGPRDVEYGGRERKHGKNHKLYPDLALIFQNIFFGAYSLFGAWFWQSGLAKTQPTTCAAAVTQQGEVMAIVFLFELRNEHWIMGATIVSALFGSIFIIIFVTHVVGLNKGIQFGPVTAAAFVVGIFSAYSPYLPVSSLLSWSLGRKSPQIGTAFRSTSLTSQIFFLLNYCIVNLLGPVVSIVSVERMLRANNIISPEIGGSAGQTISLFTGVCSMLLAVREVWKWSITTRKEAREDELQVFKGTAGTSTTLPLNLLESQIRARGRPVAIVVSPETQPDPMIQRSSTF